MTDSQLTDVTGEIVFRHREPPRMPRSPTIKLKGVPMAEGLHYARADGQILWLKRISVHAHVEVYDGESLFWRWSGAEGVLFGGD